METTTDIGNNDEKITELRDRKKYHQNKIKGWWFLITTVHIQYTANKKFKFGPLCISECDERLKEYGAVKQRKPKITGTLLTTVTS